MKNIKYRDVMADAKKSPLFKKYAEAAKIKLAIADVVFGARISAGMSQTDLAKRAGTSQRIISNIESGQINLGSDLRGRIAKALGIVDMFGESNFGANWKFTEKINVLPLLSESASNGKINEEIKTLSTISNF